MIEEIKNDQVMIEVVQEDPIAKEERLKKEAEDLAQLEEFLKTLNMAKCSCGNMMEITKGTVNFSQKDDFGNRINEEAALHMSEYRIRCTEC